jgi:hypothetical protein
MNILPFLALVFSCFVYAQDHTVLSFQRTGQKVLIHDSASAFTFTTRGVKGQILNRPCSQPGKQYFLKRLKKLEKKSLSVKTPDALNLIVMDQPKQVSPQSPLGKFVLNIEQPLLTLKKETASACKK